MMSNKETRYKVIGEFDFNERYDINDWITMSTCCILSITVAVFLCQEANTKMNLHMAVSDTAILLLQPEEKRKNYCSLKLWATLHSLAKLERDLDFPNKVLFHWHQKGKRVLLFRI